MNEKQLLFLLLLLSKDNTLKLPSGSGFVKKYIETLECDPHYSLEKIHIAENISPYIPTEFSPSFNRAILISKAIIKVKELEKCMDNPVIKPQNQIHFENETERVKKIVSIIQRDTSKVDIKNR